MVRQINWTKLINDILRSNQNIDLAFIAKKLGVHYSSVNRWRSYNTEPKYRQGEALISLWRCLTNNQDTNLPYI